MSRDDEVSAPGAPAGRPARVLVVEDQLGEDGATRSTLRLVDRWGRAGSAVVLLALRRHADPAVVPPGVRPLYPSTRELRQRWMLLLGAWRALRLARTADVIVAGREIGWGLLVARLAASLARRPLVVVVRAEAGAAIEHHMPRRLRPLARRAITSADRVVCISPGLQPATVALGVPPGRVRVVLNGVDVDDILRRGRRPARLLPDLAPPVVVGVGRLVHQKGFDTLVRAHAQVVGDGTAHTLLLLGEGRQRAALEALAQELGVAGSVVMPGFVGEPLPEVAAADLFCLSSRWEGFGQGLAEAMLLGTPCVATDCVSGPRYLLADGAHGDVVPVDDVDALATAVRRHLEQPERLRQAAAHGRRWALAHLGVDRCASELLEVLVQVAARRR